MTPSLKTYGFEYEYSNRKFAFSLDAESMEEAQGRVAALAGSVPVGSLILAAEADQEKDNSN